MGSHQISDLGAAPIPAVSVNFQIEGRHRLAATVHAKGLFRKISDAVPDSGPTPSLRSCRFVQLARSNVVSEPVASKTTNPFTCAAGNFLQY
jgi:hypothetical protein